MIIGIDVGGTHTDGVLVKKQKSNYKIKSTAKVKTLADNIKSSVLEVLDHLTAEIENKEIKRIVLSTTLVTNIIYEKKYKPVGLILIPGPGLNHQHLEYGEENIILDGYIDHRGKEVKSVSTAEIKDALAYLQSKQIENVAVVGKFSVRNPVQEEKVKQIITEGNYNFKNVTLGHQLSGNLNYHRRIITSYYNTAVSSIHQNFINSIEASFQEREIEADIYLLKCDGGTANLESSKDIPIETVNSGPAASIMGTMVLNQNSETGIALDIGGTTTDFGLFIKGDTAFKPKGIEIDKHPTLIRGLYTYSIPLGGDSRVKVEKGKIKVGPERKGPAAAFGGPAPTPTDALLVLDQIKEDQKNKLDFDLEKAKSSLAALKDKLDLNLYSDYLPNDEVELKLTQIAQIIIDQIAVEIKKTVTDILNNIKNQPVYTINELLKEPEIEPEYIIGIGGPAAALTELLAEKLNLKAEVPKYSKVANALGAAFAHPTIETTVRADTARGFLDIVEAGIHRQLKDRNFDLQDAEKLAEEWTLKRFKEEKYPVEIISRECFNVIRNRRNKGQIIEVKAQIKPGLIADLKGGKLII
ncbi:N-methylhydantoinase (ATP-hydrolyzing) [Halanaerobium saccharolyticum subsp. saccharolyticum DSM 6643]|uniref:N-methylhydantoinase (ATP-hydrolyzing) n=1 Tax=Halanaerobium saccharolyticum subsp. saccharolyticum DSM 6643 TaxID=1293054 RepID=M5E012_9FIRM|nr:hydantoinase/oxoprolinase family protein [Halanaerobium saccharolyticum]CCU78744.1 N-methylhydantoinase (ATP-hydrolyzing) [Halanaerobium saccharolyticum subsp. saccharolyticum DSM 6643]